MIKKAQVRESKNNRILESKICRRCNIALPISSFQWVKNSRLRAGGRYHSNCKKCRYNSISEASKDRKRKADAERLKAKYGTPEYIAIQKRSIEKRKAEKAATWHEYNTGKKLKLKTLTNMSRESHSFSIHVAKEVGLKEAIILEHILFILKGYTIVLSKSAFDLLSIVI